MQKDFAHSGGSAYIDGTEEIIAPLSELANIFRKHGKAIFHIIRLYHQDGSNAELCRKDSISSGRSMVVPHSEGAEIITDLLPEISRPYSHEDLLQGNIIQCGNSDYVLYKPRWGAFYHTMLHDLLQSKGITSLFIAGCNFPNCPRTTIYEASERDYKTAIIPATISGLYERGLKEMQHIGVHVFDALSPVDFFLKSGVMIIDYQPTYKHAFETLNKTWLNKYFEIEPIDDYVLTNPEDAILKNGGKILFALKDGEPVGTVALKKLENGNLELTKMAVHENHQGLGIGKALCLRAIEEAKGLEAKELILFSHSRLKSALNIYRTYGFAEIEVDKTKYKRANVMMVLPL
ncbi:GNAT family N-acetyltransferase [Parapedobacter koreensis]